MKVCDRCSHVHRQESRNPHAWLCDLFKQDRLDPLTGAEKPPFHYCRDILRYTCPNDTSPCTFFEPLPEVGEAVVKEGIEGKSVSFKKKETVE